MEAKDLEFHQTKGGMYNSIPDDNEVLEYLKNPESLEDACEGMSNNGHGEGVQNHRLAVELCIDCKSIEEMGGVLSRVKIVER